MNRPTEFRIEPNFDYDKQRDAYERAREDAARDIASDLPDPRDYAAYGMSLETRSALLTASFDSIEHAWKVQPDIAAYLRPFGLVGYGTVYLTAFGTKVFKALRRIEQ